MKTENAQAIVSTMDALKQPHSTVQMEHVLWITKVVLAIQIAIMILLSDALTLLVFQTSLIVHEAHDRTQA